MNPNLQNTTSAAANPTDVEKAQLEAASPLRIPPGPPNYYAVYQSTEGAVALPLERARNVRRRRFWHFTVCSTLLLFLLWRPVVRPVANFAYMKLTHGGRAIDHHWDHAPMAEPSDCSDTVNWTYDAAQAEWDWPYHAHASLSLPVDAEELFFDAEGALAHGSIEVSQSQHAGKDVLVDIDVAYRLEDALDAATVCHLHPSDNRHGLGIFTDRHQHRDFKHQLRFHIHVSIPATENGAPRTINAFNTRMHIFTHHLHELADTVVFNSIDLSTTNAGIRADSLKTVSGKIRSSNGKIEGTFNASSSLELVTSNAPVHITANLLNKDKDAATLLTLATSNADIHADIGLFADSVDGAYRVDTRTSNGPATVAVTSAPANSLLNASTESSNAPVVFKAPAAFEGTFELLTSSFAARKVEDHETAKDPLGKDRKRNVQFRNVNRAAVRGEVGWEPKHKKAKNGQLALKSSNSPVTLIF